MLAAMLLDNATPYSAERFAIFNKDAAEVLVVVLKATFDLSRLDPPVVSKEQEPIFPADKYFAEPGKSSMLRESDLTPPRPNTGVTLNGHAVAPNDGATHVLVGVRVGAVEQTAVVFGPRHWESFAFSARISKPEPFQKVPLIWENAFGGVDSSAPDSAHHESVAENPVGRGFFAKKTKNKYVGQPLPQIEHQQHPIKSPKDRPPPAGFTPIPPSWHPRSTFAGTYDDEWKKTRNPFLPDDFDERFHQTAPPALISPIRLKGGEPCTVVGVSATGALKFSLPMLTPEFHLRWRVGGMTLHPDLDMVHIDSDAMKLHLTFRASAEVHGRLETLQRVQIVAPKHRPA